VKPVSKKRKRKSVKNDTGEEGPLELPALFKKDLKQLDKLVQKDPNTKRRIEAILDTTIRLGKKARRHFLETETHKLIGDEGRRVLVHLLRANDFRILELIEKDALVSKETMKSLYDVVQKYGYELEYYRDAAFYENNWKSIRSHASYSIDRELLQIKLEILTVANEILLLEGPFDDMLQLVCIIASSLRLDLENIRKGFPDLVFRFDFDRLKRLQQDLRKIKKLCEPEK